MGIIFENKKRTFFLGVNPDCTFLELWRMTRLPEKMASPKIVENKAILNGSEKFRFIIEEISLSKESTKSTPIKINGIKEDNMRPQFELKIHTLLFKFIFIWTKIVTLQIIEKVFRL
jgi:hypothetical protein